ncbi:hypothetical protein HELRODRAFT_182036 [Helobdella robusta]|uniref:Uncharacterized protein n=1 Tax=Helobdella robusta TaxID=6412 RepID=T1FHM5_HELRO|nr:hypothetical protein HELRODRAFT_182036 [Helobdella robusta]ESN91859.1 hypothetical protein HELRODRAFT_182036 [Helobdella robusta]
MWTKLGVTAMDLTTKPTAETRFSLKSSTHIGSNFTTKTGLKSMKDKSLDKEPISQDMKVFLSVAIPLLALLTILGVPTLIILKIYLRAGWCNGQVECFFYFGDRVRTQIDTRAVTRKSDDLSSHGSTITPQQEPQIEIKPLRKKFFKI